VASVFRGGLVRLTRSLHGGGGLGDVGGIVRVETDLKAFRDRKGTSRTIVGVDEGGATEQGLRLAAGLFDEAYVFYSGDGRTFHPKVYYLTGASRAVAFIGSNNLTPGGTFFNLRLR